MMSFMPMKADLKSGTVLLLYFVRFPETGRVKTRLARDIGGLEAARLYERIARHNYEVLRAVRAAAAGQSPGLFEDIPWSTSSVTARTLERIRGRGLSAAEITMLDDLDTAETLPLAEEELDCG